jgi:oligopeptide transport system ATP-binding protein
VHPSLQSADSSKKPLLQLIDVAKHFDLGRGRKLNALQDINLEVFSGETLGVVGESGCGKSTLGRTILRLYEPDNGKIIFKGQDISHLNTRALKPFRRNMQMIFQDPFASLNPRLTVAQIIQEALDIHSIAHPSKRRSIILELLKTVGLLEHHYHRYPHEFSGGQRQRIGIARALSLHPELVICDEPISALDVSIQAQIINLLEDLQEKYHLTYIFIAHDLAVVRHISDRIVVMYLGHIVEIAPSEQLYHSAQHPYTQSLLSAIPVADPITEKKRERLVLQGDPPSPLKLSTGCPFVSRCPKAFGLCALEKPKLREISPGHFSACHLNELPSSNA